MWLEPLSAIQVGHFLTFNPFSPLGLRIFGSMTIHMFCVDLAGNAKKVQHLLNLPNAKTHLSLWKADLAIEGSFDEPIRGCTGVFHVATPMDFESQDPEVLSITTNSQNWKM